MQIQVNSGSSVPVDAALSSLSVANLKSALARVAGRGATPKMGLLLSSQFGPSEEARR